MYYSLRFEAFYHVIAKLAIVKKTSISQSEYSTK